MSTLKDYMVESLHKIYWQDNWILNLYQSAGLQLDDNIDTLEQLLLNLFFDSANEEATERYEKDLGINYDNGETLTRRQENVEARWKGVGKCSLELLQNIADSYNSGKTTVEFLEGCLRIKIFSEPISKYKEMITQLILTKPAHLGFTVAHSRKLPLYLGNWIEIKRKAVLYPVLSFTTDIINAEYFGVVCTADKIIDIYPS